MMNSCFGFGACAVILFCCEGVFSFLDNTTTNVQERYSKVRYLPSKAESKPTTRPRFYWEPLPTTTAKSFVPSQSPKLSHTDDGFLNVAIPTAASEEKNEVSRHKFQDEGKRLGSVNNGVPKKKSATANKKGKGRKGNTNRKRKQKGKNKKVKARKRGTFLEVAGMGKNITANDSSALSTTKLNENTMLLRKQSSSDGITHKLKIRQFKPLSTPSSFNILTPQNKHLELSTTPRSSSALLFDTTAIAVTKSARALGLKKNEQNAYSNLDAKTNQNRAFLIKEADGGVYNGTKIQQRGRCGKKNGGCAHICNEVYPNMCSCLEGFVLAEDGKKCVDINECLSDNGGCMHQCHNTWGSFYCGCPAGLRIGADLRSCEDVNECLLRNGHGPCEGACTNTFGSYLCSCSGLDGTRLSADSHGCEDIDECAERRGGCSHGCINARGRAFCTCPPGMELGGDRKTCSDVDECALGEVRRQCRYGCENVAGSYRCLGWGEQQRDRDQAPPERVTCPPLFPPKHGFFRCSRKRAALASLQTKGDRERVTNRPGTFCELGCPSGFKIVNNFRVFCSLSGDWVGHKTGKCIRPEIGWFL